MPPSRSSVPLPQPLAEALADSAALANLRRRIDESRARYEAVIASIPEPLRSGVRPGPLDDDGWSLLASNAAVAAKLRHLLPRLEAALLAGGWRQAAIRIKVQRQQ